MLYLRWSGRRGRGPRKARRGRAPWRPSLEPLEGRWAPAVFTWTGQGATASWGDGANWDQGGAIPDSGGDTVVFPATSPQLATTNDAVGGVAAIVFQGSGYTVAGTNTMTVHSAGIDAQNTSGTNTVAQKLIFDPGTSVPLSVAAGGQLKVTGALTSDDTVALEKIGGGELVMAGANGTSLTGTTEVKAGTLTVGANNALGSGALKLEGGVLQAGGTFSIGNAFTVEGATIGGSGNLTLTGVGTLKYDLTVNNTAGSVSFSNSVTGPYALKVTGAGAVVVTGDNNFSGGTAVSSGTLMLGSNTGLGTGGLSLTGGTLQSSTAVTAANPVSVTNAPTIGGSHDLALTGAASFASGSTLQVNNSAGMVTLGGVASGQGGLSKAGPGTLMISGSADNMYTGTTTVLAGMVELAKAGGARALAGPLVVGGGAGATVMLMAGNQLAGAAVTVNGSGKLDLNNNPDTVGPLSLTAGQVTTGTGLLTLAGDIASNAAATPATIDGKLALGGTTRTVTTADGSPSTDLLIAAAVSGGGGLTKAGPGALVLSGTSSYSGPTAVAAGYLFLDGTEQASDITVQAGATLGGGGTARGIQLAGGHLSPGHSPGLLVANGQVTFDAQSFFDVEISTQTSDVDAYLPGRDYDQVQVLGGAIVLGNCTLQVSPATGFPLPLGARFTVLRNPNGLPISGTFANLPEGGIFTAVGGLTYQITYVGGGGHDIVLTRGVRASVTVTASSATALPGQALSFTATVASTGPGAGTPSGTVVFAEGTAVLLSTTLTGGQATLMTSTLALGNHTIAVGYAGDGTFLSGTSPAVTVSVVKLATTVTLVASSSSVKPGDPVMFTATVAPAGTAAGTPTGTVVFAEGSAVLFSTILSGGQATFTTSALAAGGHSIAAGYAGDSVYVGNSSAPVTVDVGGAAALGTVVTLTASAASVSPGQPVSFTATVAPAGTDVGTPTGTLVFAEGSTVLQTSSLFGGQATFTTSDLPAGTHVITAGYAGDDFYVGSTSAPVTVVIHSTTPPASGHRSTVAVYDPSSATWYLRTDNSAGNADFGTFAFGAPGLVPLAGDYILPDGREGIALYDPATGNWMLTDDNQTSGFFPFAGAGGLPVTIDYNGDGKDGIALYTNGTWVVGDDTVVSFNFGVPGMVPVAGDFNGDGKDGIGLFNPFTATWYLFDGGQAYPPIQFGGAFWKPVVGDWNNSGQDSIGVFDPATATWFLRDSIAPGSVGYRQFAYGAPGWLPVVGDWDGPGGQAELAAALPPPGTPPAGVLEAADLNGLRDAALARFAAAGLDAARLDRLKAATVVLVDLPGRQLGLTVGSTVYLDVNAAGYGWFVDPTPRQDEEFTGSGPLTAPSGSPAAGRMDLLTVLEHEYGHVLGLADIDAAGHANDLMADTLVPGVRRLVALDTLFAGQNLG